MIGIYVSRLALSWQCFEPLCRAGRKADVYQGLSSLTLSACLSSKISLATESQWPVLQVKVDMASKHTELFRRKKKKHIETTVLLGFLDTSTCPEKKNNVQEFSCDFKGHCGWWPLGSMVTSPWIGFGIAWPSLLICSVHSNRGLD